MKKVLFVAVCAAWLGFACSTSKVKVDELRVELRENPVGVGTAHPRFMWQIESEKSNVNQVAYQIQVAASAQELEKERTCCGIRVLSIRTLRCSLLTADLRCSPLPNISGACV